MEWAKAHFFVGHGFPGKMKDEVAAKVRAIAERVGASEGLEIVDVEMLGGGRNRVLRIFIDKPGGVTHSDCERVSRDVGTILDVEEVVPGGHYTLEVSSPGLERKLGKPADFERFLGQKARIVLKSPVENQRRWDGVLAGFADGVVTLEPAPGKVLRIGLDQVEKANLKFDW
jgi:ribosome maturation factor RimP